MNRHTSFSNCVCRVRNPFCLSAQGWGDVLLDFDKMGTRVDDPATGAGGGLDLTGDAALGIFTIGGSDLLDED